MKNLLWAIIKKEILEALRERKRQVLAAIKPQFATLLVLRTEGLDYRELASALGVKPGSVGTLLARAESSFRKEFERRHGSQ